jgi:hypothetical protein
MTDAQLFLCVVLFFYFSGRCLWRPARTLAFRSIFFERYRPVVAPGTLGNQSGSLLIADPFVPLRPVYLADLPQIFLGPEGIAIVSTEDAPAFPADLSWMRYEEIATVTRSERSVTINGKIAVRGRTVTEAAALFGQLDTLRHMPLRERSDAIRAQMKRAFNLSEARRTLRKTSGALDRLRSSANVWLAGIAIAYALGASLVGYATMTLFLLVALEAAAIHLSLQFHRLHRRLYPEEEGRHRTSELIKFLCCSPTVFHCVDAISSGLLSRFHPLVVAHLVCGPAEFDRHCTLWVRALKFAKPDNDENTLWFRAESERLFQDFLQATRRSIEQYLVPPGRLDPASASYCPRCQAQFGFPAGLCPDCEVPVLPFPASRE